MCPQFSITKIRVPVSVHFYSWPTPEILPNLSCLVSSQPTLICSLTLFTSCRSYCWVASFCHGSITSHLAFILSSYRPSFRVISHADGSLPLFFAAKAQVSYFYRIICLSHSQELSLSCSDFLFLSWEFPKHLIRASDVRILLFSSKPPPSVLTSSQQPPSIWLI